MDNPVKMFLAISQINSLARSILDRDADFVPISEADLAKMTLLDLEKVRRAYHELAYAPPSR